jgi:pimeloyl-ACP methyl ester carboxylesterase
VASYAEERFAPRGIDTVVLTAGEGDPLVFLHGAGTVTGFDSLLPLAERFRLIVPIHPGFGASADDPTVDDIHDYRRHYLDLFEELGLERMALAGHSMGGWLAAHLAVDHPERVTRLVLAAPLGMRSEEHPTTDFLAIPGDQLGPYLTADLSVFDGHVPMPPTPEFLADRYREATSASRLLWTRLYDLKLHRWLHRVTMPTLILWGDADRIMPIEQAPLWADLIPGAEVRTLPGVGHLMFDESREAVDAVGSFVGEGAAGLTSAR